MTFIRAILLLCLVAQVSRLQGVTWYTNDVSLPVTQYRILLAGQSAALTPDTAVKYLSVTLQADNGFKTNLNMAPFGYTGGAMLPRSLIQPGSNHLVVVTQNILGWPATNVIVDFTGAGLEISAPFGDAVFFLSSTNLRNWETNSANNPLFLPFNLPCEFYRATSNSVVTLYKDSLPDWVDVVTVTTNRPVVTQSRPPMP